MWTVEWEATSSSVASAHPESQGCRGVGYVSVLLPCGLGAEHKDVCESNFIKSPLWLGCVVSHAS